MYFLGGGELSLLLLLFPNVYSVTLISYFSYTYLYSLYTYTHIRSIYTTSGTEGRTKPGH